MRAATAARVAAGHAQASPWRAPAGGSLVPPAPGRVTRRGYRALTSLLLFVVASVLVVGTLDEPRRLTGYGLDAPVRLPVAADTRTERILPEVAPPPGEGGYAFLQERHDGPVRFDPCTPIHYVVREAGAPPGGAALVQEGFRQLQASTGLQFVDDGPTTEPYAETRRLVQPDRYGKRVVPVLVVWSDQAENPGLREAAGFAGPLPADPDGRGVRWVSGNVVLDTADLVRAGPVVAQAIVLHELGHLVGLDHVDDPADLMHGEGGRHAGLTPGALRGLAALGAGPCIEG